MPSVDAAELAEIEDALDRSAGTRSKDYGEPTGEDTFKIKPTFARRFSPTTP